MCGRYTDVAELSDIRLTFEVEQVELFRDWKPTYNISPSYGPGFEQLMIVRTRDGVRTLRLGRFWMIPPEWPKPLKALPTSFNARAEELANKPFWRRAFRESRCLIPATGWREFTGEKTKQPHHLHLGHSLFAFAGLSSRYTSPDGEVADTFAIVTTEANPAVRAIHDRMPLVLPAESYTGWLDPNVDPAPLLDDACRRSLVLGVESYPTDPIANNSRYEGPLAIQRVTVHSTNALPRQGTLFGEEPPPGARSSKPSRRRSG